MPAPGKARGGLRNLQEEWEQFMAKARRVMSDKEALKHYTYEDGSWLPIPRSSKGRGSRSCPDRTQIRGDRDLGSKSKKDGAKHAKRMSDKDAINTQTYAAPPTIRS